MRGHRGFTLIELLIVLAIISTLAGTLVPVYLRARGRGHTTYCMTNQRQIFVMTQTMVDDNTGTLPLGNAVWMAMASHGKILRCPESDADNAYGFFTLMENRNTDTIDHPDRALLIADAGPGAGNLISSTADLQGRHADKVIATFADGHMRVLKPQGLTVGFGQTIAFHSTRNTGAMHTFAMNVDGTGITRLTDSKYVEESPCHAPNGDRILFSSVSPTGSGSVIYQMNADGSELTDLTGGGSESQPSYGRYGQKIVYVSARDGNAEIYSMDSNGSEQIRITSHLAEDTDPAMSRDGSFIVFRSNRDGGAELYSASPNGGNLQRLTNNSAVDAYPRIAPDLSCIVFMSDRDGHNQIYRMNRDGSSQVNLSNTAADEGYPVFSPDGKKIAFQSNRDGAYKCYTMNIDGSGVTELPNTEPGDIVTSWCE